MRTDKIIVLILLLGLLQACVAVDPSKGKNLKASAINVQLGMGYLQQNNLELASEKLTKALRQDPNSASAHNAYAILQERLLQNDKAEYHYKKATSLDSDNSQANNNYGAFLCRNGRALESEKYFLAALDNPLYSTPEYAYTNAALCQLQIDRVKPAIEYLRKAIAAKGDFAPALLAMGDALFNQGDYANAKRYLEAFHRVARPSARSLWLAIRNELELGGKGSGAIERLAAQLEQSFADSDEYRSWQEIR
ncbi:MAG: type IV pilus biogenesis/stability protein PilW [Gammaproteobacteria bacterium]|nr:type IV pilus biogenesis/stability protein PilW [Gammaproteobacteria bacterium]